MDKYIYIESPISCSWSDKLSFLAHLTSSILGMIVSAMIQSVPESFSLRVAPLITLVELWWRHEPWLWEQRKSFGSQSWKDKAVGNAHTSRKEDREPSLPVKPCTKKIPNAESTGHYRIGVQ